MRKLYQALASIVDAHHTCRKRNNAEWAGLHLKEIKRLVDNWMPSGSGIDNGAQLDVDASDGDKLVFHAAFHHMNDGGMYDGWTDHTLTVRPSMIHGIRLTISGTDRNQIKDYLHEVFDTALTQEVAF